MIRCKLTLALYPIACPQNPSGGCLDAGLEVLVTDSLSWSCPLPSSLLALDIGAQSHWTSGAALPQLCGVLKGLPALRDFCLEKNYLLPEEGLTPLLAALYGCALTHLALRNCELRGVGSDGGFDLPQSLEVVDLDRSSNVSAAEWLPRLASLPLCHSVNLLHCRHSSFTLQRQSFSEASAWATLLASPALEMLLCSYDGAAALAEKRVLNGLPPINVSREEQPEEWGSRRAVFGVPPVRFGTCTLLPAPQLDSSSCWQSCI